MSVHITPIPPPADMRPSREHRAVQDHPHMAATITRTSAVELGLVIALCSTLASGVYAWTSTRKDVDQLQALAVEGKARADALERSQVERDLSLTDMRRDILEVRAGVQRLEEALERQSGARGAGGRR